VALGAGGRDWPDDGDDGGDGAPHEGTRKLAGASATATAVRHRGNRATRDRVSGSFVSIHHHQSYVDGH
jgi:hypothetical protein